MYSLKQWPLKSSTPLCLSPSPQLLRFHLLNTFLYSPDLLFGLDQHKQLKKSPFPAGCPKRRLWNHLGTQGRVLFGLLNPLNLCPLCSLPVHYLLSLFLSHSTPSIRLFHPKPIPLLGLGPPLHRASMLGCLRGQERSRASPVRGASLPRSGVVQPWMKSRDKNVCGSKSIPAITVND